MVCLRKKALFVYLRPLTDRGRLGRTKQEHRPFYPRGSPIPFPRGYGGWFDSGTFDRGAPPTPLDRTAKGRPFHGHCVYVCVRGTGESLFPERTLSVTVGHDGSNTGNVGPSGVSGGRKSTSRVLWDPTSPFVPGLVGSRSAVRHRATWKRSQGSLPLREPQNVGPRYRLRGPRDGKKRQRGPVVHTCRPHTEG